MEKETLTIPERLLLIGGSSGSLEVLLAILPLLRKDLPWPLVIVLHRNNQSDNALVELLGSKTFLNVREAEEKDLLQAGRIYIAPPDYHLLMERDGTLSLDASAKINFSRPSIDVSFMSAADVYGSGLVAILLSGANSDGTEGMGYVLDRGGTVAVQDPDEALVSYMPRTAMQQHRIKNVFKAVELATFINKVGN